MRVTLCIFLLSLTLGVTTSNLLLSWNDFALDCVRYNKSSPTVASRAVAIMSVSIHDSFCSIPPFKYKSYKYALADLTFSASDVSLEAIAVAASHTVLVALFPNQMAKIDTKYFEDLEALGETVKVFNGVYVGTRVARSVLADRATDGSVPYKPYSSGAGQGSWIPTPPSFSQAETPQWATMRPWCLKSADQFRPPAPPSIVSAIYMQDHNTVALLGKLNNSMRTQEESDIAAFWHYKSIRTWDLVAENTALCKRFDLIDQAHLYTLLNLALADAAIMAWDAKYHYGQWRPLTAIRTVISTSENHLFSDPLWNPLLETPPWPDYVSYRAALGATAAQMLIRMFGNTYSFNITSSKQKVTRSYSSFWSAAFEEAQSQVYAGSHFNTSCMVGLQCGKMVADWIYDQCFQQNNNNINPTNNNIALIVILSLIGSALLIIIIVVVVCVIRRKKKAEQKSPFVLEEVDSQSNQDLQ